MTRRTSQTARPRRAASPPTVCEETVAYGGGIVIYQDCGHARLEVRLERDTVWLTQKQLSELFDTERSVVTKHLRNVFQTGELDRESVCAFFAHTAADGKTYRVAHYNLDAALSVGYRVNSKRGTQFRVWATNVLRDHIVKGFTANERRLKNHSFVDGNKRIAAAIFLCFMQKNGILYRPDGAKRIADNALVAITLMAAESAPGQKDAMARIIVELINERN